MSVPSAPPPAAASGRGGKFVLLKEASAPIVVAGRHWGGLRLAFWRAC